MRPVIVKQDSRPVTMIVGVAADVIAFFDDKACLAKLAGNSLGQHRTGKTCTDDQEIKHYENARPQYPNALPVAALGRGRLRFVPVNNPMPSPVPTNPLRHGIWNSLPDKRPVIDVKLPDFLSYIFKSAEKRRCLLVIVHPR